MDIKDIKIGETYNVRVKVLKIENGKHVITDTLDSDGCINTVCTTTFLEQELSAFSPITPAPKYDPCRKFRKGDIVIPRERNGRIPLGANHKMIVVEDEGAAGVMARDEEAGETNFLCALFLELVTPVEEVVRFVLLNHEFEQFYEVCWKDDDEPDGRTGRTRTLATYWYHLPPQTYSQKEAKAAAEAECARLNAEYRKEQK